MCGPDTILMRWMDCGSSSILINLSMLIVGVVVFVAVNFCIFSSHTSCEMFNYIAIRVFHLEMNMILGTHLRVIWP